VRGGRSRSRRRRRGRHRHRRGKERKELVGSRSRRSCCSSDGGLETSHSSSLSNTLQPNHQSPQSSSSLPHNRLPPHPNQPHRSHNHNHQPNPHQIRSSLPEEDDKVGIVRVPGGSVEVGEERVRSFFGKSVLPVNRLWSDSDFEGRVDSSDGMGGGVERVLSREEHGTEEKGRKEGGQRTSSRSNEPNGRRGGKKASPSREHHGRVVGNVFVVEGDQTVDGHLHEGRSPGRKHHVVRDSDLKQGERERGRRADEFSLSSLSSSTLFLPRRRLTGTVFISSTSQSPVRRGVKSLLHPTSRSM